MKYDPRAIRGLPPRRRNYVIREQLLVFSRLLFSHVVRGCCLHGGERERGKEGEERGCEGGEERERM